MGFDGRGGGMALAGSVVVSVTATNTNTTATVTWPAGNFPVTPIVRVERLTTTPDKVFASPSAVTATGFTVNVVRTATTGNTAVHWTATPSTE